MINRDRVRRRRRINREINRREDYLCWSRGNKAIIALWGSCKKLHYTAAEAVICYTYCSYTCCSYMCCSSYMFYVLQVYVLQVYLLYTLQLYVLQQLYVVGSLGLLDFQGSSNVSSLPLSVSGSSFTNVDICINFTKVEPSQKMAVAWWVVLTVVAETSSRICFKQQCISHQISQRGVGQGRERGVFKYNLKFFQIKNCI